MRMLGGRSPATSATLPGHQMRDLAANARYCPFTMREMAAPSPLRLAWRTPAFWRERIIEVMVCAVIGVILALIGPYGTHEAPFGQRLIYWVSSTVVGLALFMPLGKLLAHGCTWLDLPELLGWGVGALLGAVPMAMFIAWFTPWLFDLPDATPPWHQLYFSVLWIGLGITLAFWFGGLRERAGEAKATAQVSQPVLISPDPPSGPLFLRRLPPHLGQELLALEMEDHYVRAHTKLGSALVLLRLRDAIAELDGLEGAQTHRSWWVAKAAITAIERDGRSISLKLSNGLTAPVARNSVTLLEQKGWI
jgi:hypothetical protein